MAAAPPQPDRYVSFPWYDLPEMHAATNALWTAVAALLTLDGLAGIPPELNRTRRHGTDDDGTCLFTQTCGYPLFTTAYEHFTVLGAPCYAVPGCVGPLHRSFIVVRNDAPFATLEDLRGSRFAVNEADSNSGMNLPRRLFAPFARHARFLAATVLTGSHAASAELVSSGGADAAAIDCVTFALLGRYRPGAVSALRVVGETPATPAPPLVTSRSTPQSVVASLLRALHAIAREPEYARIRQALLIADIDFCDVSAYDIVLRYEREAAQLNYPDLR